MHYIFAKPVLFACALGAGCFGIHHYATRGFDRHGYNHGFDRGHVSYYHGGFERGRR